MDTPITAKPDTPRIRYTMGPDELSFGPHQLKRGEWCGPVDNDLAREAVLPGRVEEYGFEQEGYVAPPAAPAPQDAAAPAPDAGAGSNTRRGRQVPAPAPEPTTATDNKE